MTAETKREPNAWDDVVRGELGVGAPVEFVGADGERISGVVDALWIPAHAVKDEQGNLTVTCRVKTNHDRYPFWIGPHTQLRRI